MASTHLTLGLAGSLLMQIALRGLGRYRTQAKAIALAHGGPILLFRQRVSLFSFLT